MENVASLVDLTIQIWDGLDDDRQRLRLGIYVVLLEALDGVGGEFKTAKAVVVLAGWH